jgi:secreted trypsin-like serine protease
VERSPQPDLFPCARLSAVVAALAVVSLAGCGSWLEPRPTVPAARPEGEGRPLQLPFEGTSPRDAIVRIVGQGNVTCTGTLIADDRVLTAHHCVSARDKKGRVVERDMAPEELQVELGREDFPWAEVKVRAVLAPQCGFTQGNGDIAILVLERHLIGMPTVSARIEAPPKLNDALHIHGYGRCALPSACTRDEGADCEDDAERPKKHSTELCTDAIHLRARESNNVDWVGPAAFTALAEICPGDSGGPVYSSNEDLIGVVSASEMDGLEKTKGRSVFTRLDVWGALFSAAEEVSKGASVSELPPYGECGASSKRAPRR